MKIFNGGARSSAFLLGRQFLVYLLSSTLLLAALPQNVSANQEAPAPGYPAQAQPPAQATQQAPPAPGAPAPPYTQQTSEQLQ